MVVDNNQIEMKGVNLFQWRSFKKNWLKLLLIKDPEAANYSRFMRFFMLLYIRITAENYFCYHKGKRAGLLSLRNKKGSDAFIFGVAVLPKFRKKGLGKYMMDFSEKRAKETKKKFVALAVLNSNEPAVNLYKKLDYKFVGLGVTPISISIDKITKSKSNSIEFETILVYTDEYKELLANTFLSQINAVSQNDGEEYVRENIIEDYHKHILQNISKSKNRFFQVLDNDEEIGFLFCQNKGTTKSCRVNLHSKIILTIEPLSYLAEILKDMIEDNENFEKLEFRICIHQADKLTDLQNSDFVRDSTLDKSLMIKKI